MSARIARYIGVRRSAAEAGYRVFLDLLGHAAARLGLGVEDAGRILRRLKIEIPGALLETVMRDLRDRLRILGGEEISQYLEILPSILEGSRETDPVLLGSSLSFVSRLSSTLARDLAGGAENMVLGDLFVSGGLVMRSVIASLGPQRISRVWGFGINPLASLAAYASLLDLLDPRRISIALRDPFKSIHRILASKSLRKKYRSDLVLLHPLLLLEDRISRDRLPHIYRVLVGLGYGEHVIKRRLRLSVASMLLAHSVLREDGVLIAVVPAHILYKVSSSGVRNILRDRYRVAAIVEGPHTSFSGGFLKDILIAARKSRPSGWETYMVRIDRAAGERFIDILGGVGGDGVYIYRVDLRSLWGSVQSSWIHFFHLGGYDKRFAEILGDLMDSGRLVELRSIAEGVYIRRGISLRSPGFFVIPNRHWGVRHRDSSYTVIYSKEDLRELEIENSYLSPIIRRSKKRQDPYQRLVSKPTHYIFLIPPRGLYSIDREVVRYIEWGMRSRAAESAIRLFGADWYSYPYKEIYSRKPIADLFASKALWSSARVLCTNSLLSSEPAVAGNGFYAVIGGDRGLRRFLALWFNSTFFIYLFARIGRILDYRWDMFSSDDFLSLPAPRILDRYVYREAEEIVEKYGSQQLPPLNIQLRDGHGVRDEIDSLVSRLLGLDEGEVVEMRRGLLEILP